MKEVTGPIFPPLFYSVSLLAFLLCHCCMCVCVHVHVRVHVSPLWLSVSMSLREMDARVPPSSAGLVCTYIL